jgi:hypothetical protein
MFEALVQEGETIQNKARKSAEETLSEVKSKATGTWDKLEQVFEDRVARALHSLSVPTPQGRGFAGQARRRADQGGREAHRLPRRAGQEGRRVGEEGRVTRRWPTPPAGQPEKNKAKRP